MLEGEFSFQHNERTINATTGSFTHIQRNVVHKYKNIGKAKGRLLVTGVPAGLPVRGSWNINYRMRKVLRPHLVLLI